MAIHDPDEPLFHWYVDSAIGKELVIALYTRPCRYGQCAFCSLPSMSAGGEVVEARNVERQIDSVLARYTRSQLDAVAKVSVYTASSVLDQVCLPTRSLFHLMLRVCDLPALRCVSLETRPGYVEDWELTAVRAILGPRVELEIGIGYETHDEHLRNVVLKKGLSERALHRLLEQLKAHGCSLKAYVMLKPHHSLDEEQGLVEARNGVNHLADLGEGYGVDVAVHLNPTYMAVGCPLTEEMRRAGYAPPEAASILGVVEAAKARGLAIYVGLDDEGLAREEGTFRTTGFDRQRFVAAVLAFNRHQDLDRLRSEVRG